MPAHNYGTGWKAKRKRILDRDGWRCGWCDTDLRARDTVATVDHVVSIQAGTEQGWTRAQLEDDDNLVASCKSCNSSKGKRSRPTRLDSSSSSTTKSTTKKSNTRSTSSFLTQTRTARRVDCRSLSPVGSSAALPERAARWTLKPAGVE
jgi:5-methylcytosine-specific restriction endonuclease McrA